MLWITALMLQQWADTLSARTKCRGRAAELVPASEKDFFHIRFLSGDKC